LFICRYNREIHNISEKDFDLVKYVKVHIVKIRYGGLFSPVAQQKLHNFLLSFKGILEVKNEYGK